MAEINSGCGEHNPLLESSVSIIEDHESSFFERRLDEHRALSNRAGVSFALAQVSACIQRYDVMRMAAVKENPEIGTILAHSGVGSAQFGPRTNTLSYKKNSTLTTFPKNLQDINNIYS